LDVVINIILSFMGVTFGLLMFMLQQIIRLNKKVSELTVAIKFICGRLNISQNIITDNENCVNRNQQHTSTSRR